MNATTKWIIGLAIFAVVAYGGYRVIKHFMRLATPAPVATIIATPTMTPPTETPTPTPVPTKTPKANVTVPTTVPTQAPNIYGY